MLFRRARRVRRVVRAGRRRGGVRRATACGAGEVLDLLGRLVDKSLVGAEEERGETATGCSRRSASTRASAWPKRARRARPRGAPPRLVPGRGASRRPGAWRASASSSGSSSSSTTCARRWPPGCATIPAPPCGLAVALWPLWMRRGYFTEGSRLLDAALAAESAAHAAAGSRAGAPRRRWRCAWRERSASSRSPTRRARSTRALGDRRAAAARSLPRGDRVGTRARVRGRPPRASGGLRRWPTSRRRARGGGPRHAQGVDALLSRARRRGPAADGGRPGPARRPPRDSDTSCGRRPSASSSTATRAASRACTSRTPCSCSAGRPRGGDGLHAVQLRASWPAPRATHDAAREALDRALALHRERDDRRHRGRAQRPGQPRALARAVRARARMARGGARDPA